MYTNLREPEIHLIMGIFLFLCVNANLQLLPALVSADQEISQRIKAGESRWSSSTVADLQTTSEGTL